MKLNGYFSDAKGHGILSTADGNGRVNSAVFSRPHVIDDGTVAFVMAHRSTYENLQSNPSASYLFVESASGYAGKRLSLTKIREEKDKDAIDRFRKERFPATYERYKNVDSTLVTFRVDDVRPLVGDGAGDSE